MAMRLRDCDAGHTIVELMVTIVIVTVLAATVGVFVVRLLTLQEDEREEAYVREKLVDICGAYADFLSVGSLINTNGMVVTYRQEAGGVSFETGVVERVTSVRSWLDAYKGTLDLNVYGLESGSNVLRLVRNENGIVPLIPLMGDIVSYTIAPFGDTALATLRVSARYNVKKGNGKQETKETSVERIVRLWNHE